MNTTTHINAGIPSVHAIRLRACGGAAGLQVDRIAGVIRNVAVLTAGLTKTSGGGTPPFMVDAVALQQIADAINNPMSPVRSRVTHVELTGEDELDRVVGAWSNARIVGDRVVADFTLGAYAAHSPTGNLREFILGLAEDASAWAGVSIYSPDATLAPADVESGRVLRIGTLRAVDWVGEPAGNPEGMLSAATTTTEHPGAALAPSTGAAMPQGVVMFTSEQIAYLRTIGLPEGASDEAVTAFVATLTPEQTAALSAATTTTIDSGAAAAPVSASAAPAGGTTISLARLSELNEIAQLAGLGGDFATEMAITGKTVPEARQIALARKRATGATRDPIALSSTAGTRVNVGRYEKGAALTQAVSDALLLRARGGHTLHRFTDAENVSLGGQIVLSADGRPETRPAHELASRFRGRQLIEMGREYLVQLGCHKAATLSRNEVTSVLLNKHKFRRFTELHGVALSHATGDFPFILSDAMGKSIRAAYVTAPRTWDRWARRATAPDFKAISRMQLGEAPTLESMEPGEEYKYGTMSESQETYRLVKFGKGLSFTREMMINDDLGAFDRIPTALGRAGVRIEETSAYAILTANAAMSDAVNLFATGHSNLTTGVPSVTALGAMRAALRKQTPLGGDSSNPLDLDLAVIVCPAALETALRQLVASDVDPGKNNATTNPFKGLEVVSSARLDATSATVYYGFASFDDIDTVELSFLEGEEGLVVEQEEDFDTDTIKIKARHHVAAKAIDHRGMVRSSGA